MHERYVPSYMYVQVIIEFHSFMQIVYVHFNLNYSLFIFHSKKFLYPQSNFVPFSCIQNSTKLIVTLIMRCAIFRKKGSFAPHLISAVISWHKVSSQPQ